MDGEIHQYIIFFCVASHPPIGMMSLDIVKGGDCSNHQISCSLELEEFLSSS